MFYWKKRDYYIFVIYWLYSFNSSFYLKLKSAPEKIIPLSFLFSCSFHLINNYIYAPLSYQAVPEFANKDIHENPDKLPIIFVEKWMQIAGSIFLCISSRGCTQLLWVKNDVIAHIVMFIWYITVLEREEIICVVLNTLLQCHVIIKISFHKWLKMAYLRALLSKGKNQYKQQLWALPKIYQNQIQLFLYLPFNHPLYQKFLVHHQFQRLKCQQSPITQDLFLQFQKFKIILNLHQFQNLRSLQFQRHQIFHQYLNL